MIKSQYVNTNGFVTGLKGAIRRQGLPVSKAYRTRVYWTTTEGIEVEAQYDEVHIHLNFHKYAPKKKTFEDVANALIAEGVAESDIAIKKDHWGNEYMAVQAKAYVKSYL